MPAIASLEDLKAAQKEGLSIYAMLSALCALRYSHDLRLTSYGNIFTPCAMLYALCDICWAVVTGKNPRAVER
jgi:hypothetical protein